MAEHSSIEWTDATFNPWIGCTKVSPGCDNCYAELLDANRFSRTLGPIANGAREQVVHWGPGAPRHRTKSWDQPKRWNDDHAAFFAQHGRRRRVFCASLADVFDNEVPVAWRADLLDLIAKTSNLDWLLLTKRIGNVHRMVSEALVELGNQEPGVLRRWPLPNVWLGATIVNQEEADRDIPKLLATPARVRFLSMEPLLGPVSLRWLAAWPENEAGRRAEHPSGRTDHLDGLRRLDWVIVGGESGPTARPMHPEWARSLRDQCAAAGVPFLFKQHGEWAPGSGDFGRGAFKTAAVDNSGRVVRGGYEAPEYPKGSSSADGWAMVHLAGKKAAGRVLDGRTHDEFPEATCS